MFVELFNASSPASREFKQRLSGYTTAKRAAKDYTRDLPIPYHSRSHNKNKKSTRGRHVPLIFIIRSLCRDPYLITGA